MIHVRLLEVAVAGVLTSLLIILLWLHPRPDLATVQTQAGFWIKGLYTAALAMAGLLAVWSLTQTRSHVWPALAFGGAIVLAMAVMGGVQALGVDPVLLAELYQPRSLVYCLTNILALAAPMLALSVLVLRRAQLERPAATALAAGVFCGGLAATVYGLHCRHMTLIVVDAWYTAAIALCGLITVAGVTIRPRRAPSAH